MHLTKRQLQIFLELLLALHGKDAGEPWPSDEEAELLTKKLTKELNKK